MSEKRFTMYQNTIYEDGNIISAFTCMKRLNALYDENEQLKQGIESDEFLIKIYENFLEKRGYDINDVITGLYDIKR